MDQYKLESELHSWVLEHGTKIVDGKKLGKALYEIFAEEARKKAAQDKTTTTMTENRA